jgi:hypothetical protein
MTHGVAIEVMCKNIKITIDELGRLVVIELLNGFVLSIGLSKGRCFVDKFYQFHINKRLLMIFKPFVDRRFFDDLAKLAGLQGGHTEGKDGQE